ncbi:hypothetical protein MTO96_040683 [Rhipicephalus appendiculatus]
MTIELPAILLKRAHLQQLIRSHLEKAQVVFLQETLAEIVAILGYRSVAKHEEGRGVGVRTGNKLRHVIYNLQMSSSRIEHIKIKVIPGPVSRGSTFTLNVYSIEKDMGQGKNLVSRAAQLDGDFPLVIAGDINAPYHT